MFLSGAKMNKEIDELFDSFETKSKNPKEMFNDFLYHVFVSFESMIKSKKHKRKSNKYIQMRQKIINYLIANENAVKMKLCR
tara:strand:+ start:1702 stop:1947 length:246 start_codon:yes stop_codon:yes gene_type:complete